MLSNMARIRRRSRATCVIKISTVARKNERIIKKLVQNNSQIMKLPLDKAILLN